MSVSGKGDACRWQFARKRKISSCTAGISGAQEHFLVTDLWPIAFVNGIANFFAWQAKHTAGRNVLTTVGLRRECSGGGRGHVGARAHLPRTRQRNAGPV